MRRLLFAIVLLACVPFTACIIGPKQDDPQPGAPDMTDTGVTFDASFSSDTGAFDATAVPADAGAGADTPAPPSGDGGDAGSDASTDAGTDASTDASTDAASDALSDVSDGG